MILEQRKKRNKMSLGGRWREGGRRLWGRPQNKSASVSDQQPLLFIARCRNILTATEICNAKGRDLQSKKH